MSGVVVDKSRQPAPALLAKLVEGLVEERSLSRLAEFVGVHDKTAARYLKALRDRRLVHIAEWEEDGRGRRLVPVY
jgi:predicted ArsR family transcriptional regulator